MSRKDAHAFAASLAATLMVSIVVFQAGDGTFGAVPADEIDGDEVVIVSNTIPSGEASASLPEGPGKAQVRPRAYRRWSDRRCRSLERLCATSTDLGANRAGSVPSSRHRQRLYWSRFEKVRFSRSRID